MYVGRGGGGGLTVYFECGKGGFTHTNWILGSALVLTLVTLTCILYGQIATINDAYTLRALQIQFLAALLPCDRRFRNATRWGTLQKRRIPLCDACVLRLQAKLIA